MKDIKNPEEKDIKWVKENIIDILEKDETDWVLKGNNTSIKLNKQTKTFYPTVLSIKNPMLYEYTKVILEKLGWSEAQEAEIIVINDGDHTLFSIMSV